MIPFISVVTLIFGSWLVELGQGNQLRISSPDLGISITGTIHIDAYGNDSNDSNANGDSSRSQEGGWTIVPARDGVADRLAIVDPRGDAQLYILFLAGGDSLQMRVEHRTRQFFPGTVSFDGKIDFPKDSWACKTTPPLSERVLPFVWGTADSTLNDSLFAPEKDLALRVSGSGVQLGSTGEKNAEETCRSYRLSFSGAVDNPAASVWCFSVLRHYFQSRWVPYYAPLDRERVPRAPTGWMSWNTYFDQATAEDNLAEARLGKKYFQPFGMEFWSIESWQENSDHLPVSNFSNMNLETNERQFPLGMKRLADDIRALGFRPGLWMAPYGTGNQRFYEEHKDWFLHDAEGNAISSWNGRWSLDPTVPEAIDHLREIFRIASRQWGYEFFKIDGMSGPSISYMAHLYERPDVRACFHDPSIQNPFERTVAAFREGIGEDRVFLACQGHFTGPEARYADAARIGADIVAPNCPVQWEGVVGQAARTVNQVFVNNILFYTDPDTLLVGDLPTEQARVSAVVVSLPGQLLFTGDKLATLPPEKIRLIQQTLPVADIRPTNLYPRFELLDVWDLKVGKSFGCWDVVALFNWTEEEKRVGVDFAELGLAPDTTAVAREFWTGEFLDNLTGRLETTVPPRAVRLFALHAKSDHPWFLTSDRHLTQGAVDLDSLSWDDSNHILLGKATVVGGYPTSLRFYIPEGFTVQEVEGGTLSREENGRVAVLSLRAEETSEQPFSLRFNHN